MLAILKRMTGTRSTPADRIQAPKRPNLQRRFARAFEAMFSAGTNDRLTASWGSSPLAADDVVRLHQRILVARARQQATENPYGRAFMRLVRQNIVGPEGFRFHPQALLADGTLDATTNQALADAWRDWGDAENCDVAGKKSFVDFELSAVQACAKDGEFMLRLVVGEDAGPWGFALQWLDPQRCPVDYDLRDYGPNGHFIRHGIEFNRYGRPMAYHFMTTDEAETQYTVGQRGYIRIPANEIVHGYRDELGGQKRGIPWMATGLAKLRHVNGTEDSAIINARAGAAKVGVIQWKEGFGPELDEEDELDRMEFDAEAGSFPILPEGAELAKWDPQYPTGEFAPFMKHLLRATAAGWGVLYNNLTGDLEGVNYSSIRQGTLDERERWMEDQAWLVRSLHRPVYRFWLQMALLKQRIRVRGQALSPAYIAKYQRAAFQGRRWTWIDPTSDVKAAIDAKNALLKSPGQIIREAGQEPTDVYRQIAQDIKDMKAQDIPEELIALAFGQMLQQPQKQEPKTNEDTKKAA